MAQSYTVDQDEEVSDTWKSRMSERMNKVRAFLGKHFCDFCATIPTLALILFAFIIIMLVLSIIPIAILTFMKGGDIHPDAQKFVALHPADVVRQIDGDSWSLSEYNSTNATRAPPLTVPMQCLKDADDASCPGHCEDLSDVTPKHPDVECDDGKTYSWKYACSGLYPQCSKECVECNEESAFQCENKSGCIHRSRVCNRINDCADGSDELNCQEIQQSCDSEANRCDGFKNCEDGRDEKDCKECAKGAFHCKTGDRCIMSYERCDGIAQCEDQSDEIDCSCHECSVHPFPLYRCQQGERCFRLDDVCAPYSRCPNPTRRDKMYCAIKVSKFAH